MTVECRESPPVNAQLTPTNARGTPKIGVTEYLRCWGCPESDALQVSSNNDNVDSNKQAGECNAEISPSWSQAVNRVLFWGMAMRERIKHIGALDVGRCFGDGDYPRHYCIWLGGAPSSRVSRGNFCGRSSAALVRAGRFCASDRSRGEGCDLYIWRWRKNSQGWMRQRCWCCGHRGSAESLSSTSIRSIVGARSWKGRRSSPLHCNFPGRSTSSPDDHNDLHNCASEGCHRV